MADIRHLPTKYDPKITYGEAIEYLLRQDGESTSGHTGKVEFTDETDTSFELSFVNGLLATSEHA